MDDFEVGVSNICEEDYLFIYEGDGEDDDLPKYTLCGVQSGTFVVKSNVATLDFKSGEGEGGKGFSLTYETFPMGKRGLIIKLASLATLRDANIFVFQRCISFILAT